MPPRTSPRLPRLPRRSGRPGRACLSRLSEGPRAAARSSAAATTRPATLWATWPGRSRSVRWPPQCESRGPWTTSYHRRQAAQRRIQRHKHEADLSTTWSSTLTHQGILDARPKWQCPPAPTSAERAHSQRHTRSFGLSIVKVTDLLAGNTRIRVYIVVTDMPSNGTNGPVLGGLGNSVAAGGKCRIARCHRQPDPESRRISDIPVRERWIDSVWVRGLIIVREPRPTWAVHGSEEHRHGLRIVRGWKHAHPRQRSAARSTGP